MSERPVILIVDDDDGVLETTGAWLTQGGYGVRTVSEWPAITSALFEDGVQVSLVLIDVSMPTLSGDQLVPILRRYLPSDIPVVLFSGRPETELQGLVDQCGATGYIQKGASSTKLLVTIARHLRPTNGDRKRRAL